MTVKCLHLGSFCWCFAKLSFSCGFWCIDCCKEKYHCLKFRFHKLRSLCRRSSHNYDCRKSNCICWCSAAMARNLLNKGSLKHCIYTIILADCFVMLTIRGYNEEITSSSGSPSIWSSIRSSHRNRINSQYNVNSYDEHDD